MSDQQPPAPPPPPPPPPGPPPPRPPDLLAAPPPRPSRRRWVVLGVGAVVVAAGVAAFGLLNDDDDTTVASADISLDDLEPALLTEDDVGDDYRLVESGGDGELDIDQMDTSDECREVIESFEASAGSDDEVQVEFESGDDATLSHALALIQEDDPSFAEVRDDIGRCETIAFDDGETQGEIRLTRQDVDGPADDAFALELEIEATSGPITASINGYAVYSVREGVVSTLAAFGSVDPTTFEGEPVDRDLVETLTDRADEKVRQVLED